MIELRAPHNISRLERPGYWQEPFRGIQRLHQALRVHTSGFPFDTGVLDRRCDNRTHAWMFGLAAQNQVQAVEGAHPFIGNQKVRGGRGQKACGVFERGRTVAS